MQWPEWAKYKREEHVPPTNPNDVLGWAHYVLDRIMTWGILLFLVIPGGLFLMYALLVITLRDLKIAELPL